MLGRTTLLAVYVLIVASVALASPAEADTLPNDCNVVGCSSGGCPDSAHAQCKAACPNVDCMYQSADGWCYQCVAAQ